MKISKVDNPPLIFLNEEIKTPEQARGNFSSSSLVKILEESKISMVGENFSLVKEQLREEYSKIAKENMSKGGQSCPTLEN